MTDVLVFGSGIAGLSLAIRCAEMGMSVELHSKSELAEGSTRYAQGGIAVAKDVQDRELHIQDTARAGDGLCHHPTVSRVVTMAEEALSDLLDAGVPFHRGAGGEFHLHREGGHSAHRILHVHDQTGNAIEQALIKRARSLQSLQIFEHSILVDLITSRRIVGAAGDSYPSQETDLSDQCLGAFVMDAHSHEIRPIRARSTCLATGGAGQVYLHTTNPLTATGDGLACAARAGARLANLEFVQFHPTALALGAREGGHFLVTEALRGDGAELLDHKGQAFMRALHPMGSLAPRDIVARAIDIEIKRSGEPYVFLDASHMTREVWGERYPGVFSALHDQRIDPSVDQIPVVPAAHFFCGGIHVDDEGASSIRSLYAIGEVSHTGLHGANRLASNSLLEGAVYARIVAQSMANEQKRNPPDESLSWKHLPKWERHAAIELEARLELRALREEIRHLMWNYVGIVRSNIRLKKAWKRLEVISEDVERTYWSYWLTPELMELRNLTLVARLVTQSAIRRKESRGLHFNLDHPRHEDRFFLYDTII